MVRTLRTILLIGIFSSTIFTLFGADKTFCIAISSYNNVQLVKQNLSSVFSQSYQNFRVIYVSDGSTDGTDDAALEYAKSQGYEEKFTLLANPIQQGYTACIYKIAKLCDPDEVIVDLRGEDWLANREVLTFLNQIYQDENIWMTYGQFMRYPGFKEGSTVEVPKEIIERNESRLYIDAITHLKTFYAALLQAIPKERLSDKNNFIRTGRDAVYTIPLLEIAAIHAKYIPKVLYVYNESDPLQLENIFSQREVALDYWIRNQIPLLPLRELPTSTVHPLYDAIDDLKNITLNDYTHIQKYLSSNSRKELSVLAYRKVVRNFQLIGNALEELPQSGIIPVNCTLEEKENCVLLYASFNNHYIRGILRLIEKIQNSSFRGHILYKIGGWPNIEGGDIILSHVPYAFKIALFREAERLGYNKALYLDSSVVPLKSLNIVFDQIAQRGYFVGANGHTVRHYMTIGAAGFFGLNLGATFFIPACASGFFGVDFNDQKRKKVLDWWYRAARDTDAYYSLAPDQNTLSVILHQLGMHEFSPMEKTAEALVDIKPDSLFLLDRSYVR